MSEPIIYEAFTPSGTEANDHSQGLFTGDRALIQEWVAENSHWWRADQVLLLERRIHVVTTERLHELRQAKSDAAGAKARLKSITGDPR